MVDFKRSSNKVAKKIQEIAITSVTNTDQDVTVNYSDGHKDVYVIKHWGSKIWIGLEDE